MSKIRLPCTDQTKLASWKNNCSAAFELCVIGKEKHNVKDLRQVKAKAEKMNQKYPI